MCNRYRTDMANAALWEAFQDWRESDRERWDEHGRNMPPPFESFPNTRGRFVHLTPEGKLTISEGLWGMPSPAKALVTKTGKPMSYDPGVTNVRNTSSPHWRRWLGVEKRCLVPWTTFCEPDQVGGSRKDVWFQMANGQEVAYFAGIRDTLSRQLRAKDPEPAAGEFYAFLTTKANKDVDPYHDKAMPVILTTREECEAWLTQPFSENMQRPLPDGSLKVIRIGTGESPEGHGGGSEPLLL